MSKGANMLALLQKALQINEIVYGQFSNLFAVWYYLAKIGETTLIVSVYFA